MMNGRGRIVGGIVLLVAVVLGAAAIGYLAYNAGVVEGITQTAAGEALPGEAGKISPHFYGRGIRPFWPGSFLLFCLVVPFLFFLFFGVMKMVFAPWRMGGWGRGRGMKGGPWRERAEEWHRQMHEAEDQPEEGEA
ncbi:MAG: hypothetical protein IH858_13650 [Chloroflexi bacterium]|nr:hypothetical protein [Chloroflexota bacterium]